MLVERETYAEVALEVNHFVLDELGLQEGDGGVLEGMGGTTVEVLGLLAWLRWNNGGYVQNRKSQCFGVVS